MFATDANATPVKKNITVRWIALSAIYRTGL